MTSRPPQNLQPSLAILWCFRIVIALQCVGIGGRYVLSSNESESDVYGFLFFDHGWPEYSAQLIDDIGAYVCLFSGLILIVNGIVLSRKPSLRLLRIILLVDTALLIIVASWTFILAATHSVRGEVYAELTLGELAVRFATPVAMLIYLRGFGNSSKKFTLIATGVLTIAVTATFAVHGYKAQLLYGPFTDLILLTDQRLFQSDMEQATAESLLYLIGWTDIIVAGLLLFTRWRVVSFYMMLWGLISASSRLTAFGFAAWPETLIRSANWGAPLLLLCLIQIRVKFKNQSELSQTTD